MDYSNNVAVEVHNLTVSYRLKPVLWNIDFKIPSGKLIAVIGPNGAGKSTLIKSIMDLVPHSGGYVKIFGQNLKEVRKRVSYVPQKESIDIDFPISVKEVAETGLYAQKGLFKRLNSKDKEQAFDSLKKVGMDKYASRQISQLSGGQLQRVFIARAIASDADLYFMDEPFAGIDITTESLIIDLLKKMRDEGKTCVIVHHDLNTVPQYFDEVLMINTRLVAAGSVEAVFTPENIASTYGGKLSLLNRVTELMGNQKFPGTDKTMIS